MAIPLDSPILLVDGYNVLGAWCQVQASTAPSRNLFKPGPSLEIARTGLIDALANYSAFQGYQTQLVFDAQHRQDRGSCERCTDSLEIFYTDFGQTADSYIELYCAQARARSIRIIVATSDRAQQLTVIGYGAEWMSAQSLVSDLATTTNQIRNQQNSKQRSPSRSLAHSLNPEAKQRLEQWRMGLG
ncbi:MAG: NYN domain-containing protein [Acaryochloridaceae cyanobacterium SU_2_1]|nr:NYN domain-containing protein [Acaryochloridaceae cyanobacterium SU_2_1]